MAVASRSADMIEPAQTTEPSDAASEASDRNDPVTSSPTPGRDFDLQSATALRSEEYRLLFRLPADEILIQEYNCAFQESILLQGHMYMFIHYICFYSNIFGFETKKIIPFNEITCVRKAKTAGIFPNAIEILSGEKKHFFGSFLSRDEAFNLLIDGIHQHRSSIKTMTDEQESGSSIQSSDIVELEKVNSSRISVNESEPIVRTEDTPVVEDLKLLPSAEISIDSEIHSVGTLGREAEAILNSLTSSLTKDLWKQEDSDAPAIPEYFTKVAESKFPIKVEEFFDLFFSDGALNFFEAYHGKCGDRDLSCGSWYPHDKFGHVRDVSFRHPIKLYFGAKFGSCQEAQKFRVYRQSHLVIETSQEISDAPYGDYFRVQGLWDVEKDGSETEECCILRVYVNVAFSKKTMLRGRIEQATAEECRSAFALWINIAHELLKERKLEKQAVIENGQVEVGPQCEAAHPPECSEAANDQIRNAGTLSNFREAREGIGNAVQDATSFVALLRASPARIYLYLKSQSQVSFLLLATFAVTLLLMQGVWRVAGASGAMARELVVQHLDLLLQLSIVVLLSRPQQVHVISQADYVIGQGIADRSPGSLAWLERKIHHLKDEMVMVEARIETMRQEHSLLKAQINDLEQLHRQR